MMSYTSQVTFGKLEQLYLVAQYNTCIFSTTMPPTFFYIIYPEQLLTVDQQ